MRKFFLAVENWADDESMILGMLKYGFLLVVFVALMVIPMALIFGGGDEQIVLNTSEWSCTHTHTTVQPVLVGKIVVPTNKDVCDAYHMRGY